MQKIYNVGKFKIAGYVCIERISKTQRGRDDKLIQEKIFDKLKMHFAEIDTVHQSFLVMTSQERMKKININISNKAKRIEELRNGLDK